MIRWLFVALLVGLAAARASAHPVVAASAIVTVREAGRVEVTVHHDALAFMLNDTPRAVGDGAMYALLDGPREELERVCGEGRDRFQKLFELSADGVVVPVLVTIAPTAAVVLAAKESAIGPVLPVKLDIVAEGTLSAGARAIAVKFPVVMGDVVVTVAPPHAEALVGLAKAGELSEEFVIRGDAGAPPDHARESGASVHGAIDFVLMGIGHILPGREWFSSLAERFRSGRWFANPRELIPDGADHILFVLGLFFLSPRVRPLLVQITAFTLAHSVTLALAARGTITLSGAIVEPLIAASIAAVAVENLCTQKVHSWRVAVVFGFGLIHGLGFASSFAEAVGSERSPLGPVLLFNLGVEIGQLGVVAIALLTVGWWRERPWYRRRIAIPASVAIAAVGAWWTIERVFLR